MENRRRKHQTHNQRLLTSLRKSIVDKPPYISGTVQIPDSFLSLFYMVTRDGNAARRINFANATPDELDQLAQARACEGFDAAYRNAGKIDSECFSSSLDPFRTDLIKIIRGYLLEGEVSRKNIVIESYKLNIYSKGSSLNPHVDPPRNKKMFGSLVIVFPTHHEGGALLLRHHGHEWVFDPAQALAGGALDRPSIGYVAFLNNIEQDVAPVTSGHCVTLTYNLYFDDDGGPVSRKGAVKELLIPPKLPNQDGFREAFKALLENPEFMAEGGTLAFGLRHRYPVKYDFKPIYDVLKGSDAVVYHSVRALGFEPTLYMFHGAESMIIDKLANFNTEEKESVREVLLEEGGMFVRQEGGFYSDLLDLEDPEPIEWVTPTTTYNRRKVTFRMVPIDEDACMIVRIGKVGDRLVYPTVAQINAQIKEAYERREQIGYDIGE